MFRFPFRHVRAFENVVVHPTQELPVPSADHYRGGPDWPDFDRQVLVRHCWGAFPTAVDWRPHPAEPEWPYFDRERYLKPEYRLRRRGARRWLPRFDADDRQRAAPAPWMDTVDQGIWCGPVIEHFGHLVADFGMRTAASARLDPATLLVFSLWPQPDAAPPRFFWQILEHLGVDPARVLLVRRPVRFARLSVVPQAERPYGGRANHRHLRFMDAITAASAPRERDDNWVFVSRSRVARGRFAGEACLDAALAAAGVTVFHPETVELPDQLCLYRRARGLIFSEGSALQALQLLGHIDTDIAILPRRPGRIADNIASVAPLRARTRSLRILPVLQGIVCGLIETGEPQLSRGISVFDEARLLEGFAAVGIDLARFWDAEFYAARRNADIAEWIAARLAAAAHPGERAFIAQRLRTLSLPQSLLP